MIYRITANAVILIHKVSIFFDKNTIFIRKYTSKRVKYKINEFIFIFEREYFDEVNIQTKFYTSVKVGIFFENSLLVILRIAPFRVIL